MIQWLENDPIGVMLLALIRNTIYLAAALPILVCTLAFVYWYMNRSIGIKFKDHAWDIIKTDPHAVSLYFGLRVLGVLVAGGLIASSFLK